MTADFINETFKLAHVLFFLSRTYSVTNEGSSLLSGLCISPVQRLSGLKETLADTLL